MRITKEQFESVGWKFHNHNYIREWYMKEDLFVDAPMSPQHQILAATLMYDPEYEALRIEVKLRSDFEYHGFFEGKCPDLDVLKLLTELIIPS